LKRGSRLAKRSLSNGEMLPLKLRGAAILAAVRAPAPLPVRIHPRWRAGTAVCDSKRVGKIKSVDGRGARHRKRAC